MITRIGAELWFLDHEVKGIEAMVSSRYVVERGVRTISPAAGEDTTEKFLRGITGSGRSIEMVGPEDGGYTRLMAAFPGGSVEFVSEVIANLLADGVVSAHVVVLPESHPAVLAAADVAAGRKDPGLHSARWIVTSQDGVAIQREVSLQGVLDALKIAATEPGAAAGLVGDSFVTEVSLGPAGLLDPPLL